MKHSKTVAAIRRQPDTNHTSTDSVPSPDCDYWNQSQVDECLRFLEGKGIPHESGCFFLPYFRCYDPTTNSTVSQNVTTLKSWRVEPAYSPLLEKIL